MKTSGIGKAWAQFTVAVNTGEDEATWIKVAVFDGRAFFKGGKVYVEGRLKRNSWTGNGGEPRSGLEVGAWRIDRRGEIGKNKPAAGGNDAAAARGQQAGLAGAREGASGGPG